MVVPEKFFEVEFSKAMAFGYRTEDVDEFVTKAIEIIKALQEENRELTEKMEVLAQSLEKYREDEESLRSALIGAQKLGDSILKDSRSKAEVILRDATTNADRIIEEAHARLERETAEYDRLKEEVTAFREGLFDLYKAHIDQITHIPHKEKPAAPKTPAPAPAPVPAPAPAPAAAEPPAAPAPHAPDLPVLTVEEPEEEYAPAPPPEPPVKKSPQKRPALRLELEEDEDDDEEEETVTRYTGRTGRFASRRPPEDDFDDDDEDEEEELPPSRTVFSSKFGEMRFGEGFSLTGDEHRSGTSGRSGKRR